MYNWKVSLEKGIKAGLATALATNGITFANGNGDIYANLIASLVVGLVNAALNWKKHRKTKVTHGRSRT